MRRVAVLIAVLAFAGCTTSLGTVGVIPRESEDAGVKLLRPGATGRSCRASVFGVPLSDGEPGLREALEQIVALDAEGDVVVNAEVRWERFITGLYNRRCIEVRGDLARRIRTITIPMPPEHHAH
jgi:hypothetical protein